MENKPMSKKKTIISVIIVLILTIATFSIFLNFQDINAVIESIKTVNGVEMTIAFVCLLLYALTWPLSLCIMAYKQRHRAHFLDNYLVGESEHFFNGITPFATGGQPIQIYLLTKSGIKPSESTGLIFTNFIALLIATNIFAIVSLFFYGSLSENFTSTTSWMIALGFVMNIFTLVFMILMMTSKFIRNFFRKCLEALCKIKFIGKRLTKLIPVFDNYCSNAQEASKEIFSHFWTFILAIILRMISLVFYYAIPFFILRSLGIPLDYNLLPLIILASSFAITTMVWVPTPGGTGGIEFAFTTIFTASIFGTISPSVGAAGMILWRGLTYYLLLIISMLAYIGYTIRTNIKHKKGEIINDTCPTDGEQASL